MKSMTSPPSITVRRLIEASAEELFDAWLDPESIAAWMRPGTIVRTTATIDARVGGAFEITMYGDSDVYRHQGVYCAIERPQRLSFTWMSPATKQKETLVTVEFNARGAATEVVVTHEQLPSEDERQSHTAGWTSALERLAEHLGEPS
jgi:uncharacterized protein YndB with AHSA1/START domain